MFWKENRPKSNPLDAENDPAAAESDIFKQPSSSIKDPTIDLFSDAKTEHVSQIENVLINTPANDSDLPDAGGLLKVETEEPSDSAESESDIVDVIEKPDEKTDVIEVPKDKIEAPSDITDSLNDIVDLSEDVIEKPDEKTDVIEVPKDKIEAPSDIIESESDIVNLSEDVIKKPDEKTGVVEVTKAEIEEPSDIAEVESDIVDLSEDVIEKLDEKTGVEVKKDEIKEPSDIAEAESDVAKLSENIEGLVKPQRGNSEPAIDTDDRPQNDIDKAVTEALSGPILSIFSDSSIQKETAPQNDPPADNIQATSVSEITEGSMNTDSEAPRDLFEDDLFAELSLKNSGKKHPTSNTTSDLFDDEASNLFTEPLQKNLIKPQKTSLFNDPDEELFNQPVGGTSRKSANVTISEEPRKKLETKAGNISGPLSDGFTEDATDIFAEEGLSSVSASAVNSSSANSKTNGVHSDEETDIFAEATVELSLDSPRGERKQKEMVAPTVSSPSLFATASVPKPQATAQQELEEEESEDKFEINISITNPEKVGDGMNAYMGYKVSTQTTLPMFRSKTFTVRRRFSDFLGLYEKLSEKHGHNGFIVPPPPEKSILGMTKVKVGKEDPSSAEFVERRRAALERYLQRVVCHPSLLQDPDVREFLEREELPRAVSTQALSGAGFLKMISKATDAVSKMTIKMNESDVWFEEKLQEVETEDQQLRKLHVMVESLVNHRKELSVNTAGFAKSVAMLGSSEDNTALSRALSQLAEVEDKMEQLHQDQASNDSFGFAEMLADYIRLLGSVRASFDQRMKVWQRWQDAQNMLQKKRETEAKLLWANKPDKLQQAKEEISEWEAKVTQYERDFDRVSATVRKEVLRFEKEKARDFKRLIVKYLESLLTSQQQLIKYWEAFLPEAKAIA
ncbi:sorting nexin-1-like isoform X2 [Hypomesus transpacificus]|uniref:sorting nexin-1-like isoform X2 n=1 Tax=Hypomesus transpacificus TaxID=137520 RepID=UPI001F082DDC|nr:sorting nexin-1-like isoform X2 [Hypomesus transpacificus]